LCGGSALAALTTILGKQVFDLTHRELDLGLLGLAEFAPSAVLVLVTGTLADRLDRRRLSAAGMLGQAVAVAGLAWYASTDPTSVGPIFVLVVVFGTARAFSMPALRSLPADIVAPERLPWLTVRFSGAIQAAMIVGPVMGGVLYAVDPTLPFVAVTVLLVMAAVSALVIEGSPARPGARSELTDAQLADQLDADARLEAAAELAGEEAVVIPPGGTRARLHEAMEGLRFIRRQPALLGAISLDLFAVLFGGAVALLPALAEERLGVGAVGLGWLRAATGIGAALMTIALAWRPVRRRVGVTLLVSVAVFGVGTIALGVTTSFAVAFVALLVLSGADSMSVFIRGTLVPLITPADKRGRVLAVEMLFIGASNELGAFESGVAGQLMGPAAAVVLGGACTLGIAAGWWWLFPSLRDVDRFPGLHERVGPTTVGATGDLTPDRSERP
jgi:MFS family permease